MDGIEPAEANLYVAWGGFLLGSLAGAVQGLFFHREDWLGGYGSWKRRMLRLGHVAFFGIGFLNLAFALSANALGVRNGLGLASVLFMAAAAGMPLVCYLSAFRDSFRQLFFIPVLAVITGILAFLYAVLTR